MFSAWSKSLQTVWELSRLEQAAGAAAHAEAADLAAEEAVVAGGGGV